MLFELLRRFTPIAASSEPPTLLFHTGDQYIGPSVWETGGWDEDELAWALDFLGNPQERGTVLDVGANIGTTTASLLARHGAGQVIAFEPEPRNFRLLRCNLILNDLEDQVTARQVAVSDRDADIPLQLARFNLGDHRLVGESGPSEAGEETVIVPAARLDSLLSEEELGAVSLVWVDTQGHEGHVMAGASKLLARRVPWVIEYWPSALKAAGGLDQLHTLVSANFEEVVDVRASLLAGEPVRYAASRIEEVDGKLPGDEADIEHFTDLILL